jgi:hypothetical protein
MFLLGKVRSILAILLIFLLALLVAYLRGDNPIGFLMQVNLFVIDALLFEHSIIKLRK